MSSGQTNERQTIAGALSRWLTQRRTAAARRRPMRLKTFRTGLGKLRHYSRRPRFPRWARAHYHGWTGRHQVLYRAKQHRVRDLKRRLLDRMNRLLPTT